MINIRKTRINKLINNLVKNYNISISNEEIDRIKEFYYNDERPFSEILKEVTKQAEDIKIIKDLAQKNINEEILKNSILLIGPMGAGKSMLSDKISYETGMPKAALDDRNAFAELYSQEKNFYNFKYFEAYLTSSVLTGMNKPMIIDFGAGHSVYDQPLIRGYMKSLISKFSTVIYVLPSRNKEESLEILSTRIKNRDIIPEGANEYFLSSGLNEEMATNIIYGEDFNQDPDKMVSEIINIANENKKRKVK